MQVETRRLARGSRPAASSAAIRTCHRRDHGPRGRWTERRGLL